MYCEKCGAELSDDVQFCENCGAPVARHQAAPDEGSGISEPVGNSKPVEGFCAHCGTAIAPGDVFCRECGEKVSNAGQAANAVAGAGNDSSHIGSTSLQGTAASATAAASAEPGYVPASVTPSGPTASPRKKPKPAVIVVAAVAAVAVAVGGIAYAQGALDQILPASDNASMQDQTESTDSASEAASESSTTGVNATVGSSGSSASASASDSSERSKSEVTRVRVPDVTGMSLKNATAALKAAGLSTGAVSGDSASDAKVKSSKPAAGASVAKGSSVALTLKSQKASALSSAAKKHRYELVMKACTWKEASQLAIARGGYLARVGSASEWKKITAVLPKKSKAIWLGAQRVKGAFAWQDGTSLSYSHWAKAEPNNETGDENYLVTFYVKNSSGDMEWMWYDVPNDLSPYYNDGVIGFVVEYDS